MSLIDYGRKAASRATAGLLAASKAGVRLAARVRAGEIGTETDKDAAYRDARRTADREVGRVNILVAGNTGVGKSSLINAVFGDDVAPASAGGPVTQGLHRYEAPNAPLNLWDSRGFEAGGVEAVKLVEAKVAELRKQADPSEQLHVAWLCIAATSSRVEPVHEAFLRSLQKLEVPCIVVFTRAIIPMPADAKERAHPCAAQVELLAVAEPSLGKLPFGVDALIEQTYRAVPEGAKTAFVAAQQVGWTLKKTEARKVVAITIAAAATSALVPGHAVLLTGLQVTMFAKIDLIYGLNPTDAGLARVKVAATGGAGAVGRWTFGALLTDGLKASGVGFAAGVAIGGGVGATITGAIGMAYAEGVARYAENGEAVPLASLTELVTNAAAHARGPLATAM